MVDHIEYTDLVMALAKSGDTIKSSPLNMHLWHMWTGVIGELQETIDAFAEGDFNKIRKECGDVGFYLTGVRRSFDSIPDVQVILEMAYHRICDTNVIGSKLKDEALPIACRELDKVKKLAVYNEEIDVEGSNRCYTQATRILACVVTCYTLIYMRQYQIQLPIELGVRNTIQLAWGDMIQGNCDKLLKRYEGGVYSDQAAQQRVDVLNESPEE